MELLKKDFYLTVFLLSLVVLVAGCVGEDSPGKKEVPLSTIHPEIAFDYEFGDPVRVEISGYSGDAMEPFISRNGNYLFFNNLNSPDVNTNIHFAEKIGENTFKYLGEVRGVSTEALEGVASMDSLGRFYFISSRSYGESKRTLYSGFFEEGSVSGVDLVRGDISRDKIPWLNMDAEISADGQTLYFTDNEFDLLRGLPKTSNIRVADEKDGEFFTLGNSDFLLRNINTEDLEYAPSISSDGMVLYYTRARGLGTRNVDLKIYGARRRDLNDPFGPPGVISSITGFVEAPSISGDGNTLYYHKKEAGTHRIYKVERIS